MVYFKNKKNYPIVKIWLDSYLNFAFHINKKMKKAKAAKVQIKELTKTYRLCPRLI